MFHKAVKETVSGGIRWIISEHEIFSDACQSYVLERLPPPFSFPVCGSGMRESTAGGAPVSLGGG